MENVDNPLILQSIKKHVARELEHVANLPGGEKCAHNMASILRKKFPSDSSRHDELDKVGL